MAHKSVNDPNIFVFHNKIKLKTFSLYDDYAHTKANDYVRRLNTDPEFLKSQIEKFDKE